MNIGALIATQERLLPSVEEAEQDAAEKEQDALKLDQGNLGMAWQAGSLEAEQDVAEKPS